jgi:hypothetical protein
MNVRSVSARSMHVGKRVVLGMTLFAALFATGACSRSKVVESSGMNPCAVAGLEAMAPAKDVGGAFGESASAKDISGDASRPAAYAGTAVETVQKDLGDAQVVLAAMESADNTGAQAPAPAAAKRMIIYTANLGLRVANANTTRKAIEDLVRGFSGFIQRETLDMVAFRVRPEHFETAMAAIEKMGEVTARQVSSDDVTEQYFDVALRIEVAEKSRQRLMEILKNALQTKDVLEIERDIRRLTEEIEGMKGSLRVLQDQIAYATITVNLAEKVQDQERPMPRRVPTLRFEWLRDTGLDAVLGQVSTHAPIEGPGFLSRLFFGRPFHLGVDKGKVVPEGFAVLRYDGDELIASTAEDYRLRVRAVEPRQKSELKFWAETLASELADNRGYAVNKSESFPLDSGDLKATVLRCETAFGGEHWNYEVWLIQDAEDTDDMVVVEFARASKDADKHLEEVEKAVRGIRM